MKKICNRLAPDSGKSWRRHKHVNTGMGYYTMSPENHSGAESGTGILAVHWENGKMVYDQELSKVKALSMAPAKIYE